MYKVFLILFLSVSLNAATLNDTIHNIIGPYDYAKHKYLIKNLFKDKNKFYNLNGLNYLKIIEVLNSKNMIKLKYSYAQNTKIEFQSSSKSVKLIKSVKDIFEKLGYAYYFTDYLNKKNNLITWQISFKSVSMLDPYVFIKELEDIGVRIVNLKKVSQSRWKYNLDFNYSNLANVINIQNNEKISLKKPHKAYILKVNNSSLLKINSTRLNSWYPRVSFYDNNLNMLGLIKKTSRQYNDKFSIPENTMYISIDDMYTLLNIKRGLTVTVR